MKWRGALAWVVALLLVQGGAIVIWRLVESGREAPAPLAFEPLAGRAPPLELERADGSRTTLEWPDDRPVLVHFWASWCGPCRDELPGVLALDLDGIEVLAVAVDDTWPAMRQLVGDPPDRVARATSRDAVRAFGVGELPVTVFVGPGGVLRERYQGARDWRDAGVRAHLTKLGASSK